MCDELKSLANTHKTSAIMPSASQIHADSKNDALSTCTPNTRCRHWLLITQLSNYRGVHLRRRSF